MRVYRSWAGSPNGTPENVRRCVKEVADGCRSVLSHQCIRTRGHGPAGEYCKQHARKASLDAEGKEKA